MGTGLRNALTQCKNSITADAGYRVRNNFQEPATHLTRILWNYRLDTKWTMGAGLAWFCVYKNHIADRDEYRPFLELQYFHNKGRLRILHRAHAEERYFVNRKNGQVFSYLRPRYRIISYLPINHEKIIPKTFFLILGNEIFFHLPVKNHLFFDQNRLISGFGYQLKSSLSISLNYVFQHAIGASEKQFQFSHITWLSINYSTGMVKK